MDFKILLPKTCAAGHQGDGEGHSGIFGGRQRGSGCGFEANRQNRRLVRASGAALLLPGSIAWPCNRPDADASSWPSCENATAWTKPLWPSISCPFQAHHHMGTALDPFECFGRALASHNYKIRHVPYTTPDGIIGTHAYFIKRAAAVIFVTSVTYCEPRVKVLAAGKPLMVLTWNIPVLH
jgi:hypothetical protein